VEAVPLNAGSGAATEWLNGRSGTATEAPMHPVWDSEGMRRWLFLAAVAVGPISLGACTTTSGLPTSTGPTIGPPACSNYSSFALSHVENSEWKATPVEAAEWFGGNPGMPNIPRTGWHEATRDSQGATVYSGRIILHVIQGPDGKWQVDGTRLCT
jgi:hypothetical protein